MVRLTQTGPDCFSICVACLLNLPADAVPDFIGDAEDTPQHWTELARDWLKCYGVTPIVVRLEKASRGAIIEDDFDGLLWIAVGPPVESDERAECHAVIYRGKRMEHDPHPSRAGLRDINEAFLLVPFDVGEVVKHRWTDKPDSPGAALGAGRVGAKAETGGLSC